MGLGSSEYSLYCRNRQLLSEFRVIVVLSVQGAWCSRIACSASLIGKVLFSAGLLCHVGTARSICQV